MWISKTCLLNGTFFDRRDGWKLVVFRKAPEKFNQFIFSISDFIRIVGANVQEKDFSGETTRVPGVGHLNPNIGTDFRL